MPIETTHRGISGLAMVAGLGGTIGDGIGRRSSREPRWVKIFAASASSCSNPEELGLGWSWGTGGSGGSRGGDVGGNTGVLCFVSFSYCQGLMGAVVR